MSSPVAPMTPAPCAGDVSPAEAWEQLRTDPHAVLVDVRTRIELALTGGPDLSSLSREPVFVEWMTQQGRNPEFLPELKRLLAERAAGPDTPILFLCRTAGRSRMAAGELTVQGFTACYNISEGFEGSLDPQGHRRRGGIAGRRADCPGARPDAISVCRRSSPASGVPTRQVLIDTRDFGRPNCRATSAMSSALALPSTGGDLSVASQVPSASCSRALTRAFGFTLTWIVFSSLGPAAARGPGTGPGSPRFSASVARAQADSSARVRKHPKHRPSAPMQQMPEAARAGDRQAGCGRVGGHRGPGGFGDVPAVQCNYDPVATLRRQRLHRAAMAVEAVRGACGPVLAGRNPGGPACAGERAGPTGSRVRSAGLLG